MARYRLEYGIVDLDMLKEQRGALLRAQDHPRTRISVEASEAIDGMINMIDAIADHCEDNLTPLKESNHDQI